MSAATFSPRQLAFRLFSSSILIALVLGTIFRFPLWIFFVVVTAVALIGLYEFFAMARHRGVMVPRTLGLTLGFMLLLLVARRTLFAAVPEATTLAAWAYDIFWPAAVVMLFLRQLGRTNTFEALEAVAVAVFGLAYVPGLLSWLFHLRSWPDGSGPWLVCYLILVTKMGDAGAYAVGNVIGRRPLIPRISPGKTIEGFIGAMLASGAAGATAHRMVPWLDGSAAGGFLLGLVLGLVGLGGDLAESLLKRDCKVKDASGLFPGLGGMLDILDSLLFTAPVFYAILSYAA